MKCIKNMWPSIYIAPIWPPKGYMPLQTLVARYSINRTLDPPDSRKLQTHIYLYTHKHCSMSRTLQKLEVYAWWNDLGSEKILIDFDNMGAHLLVFGWNEKQKINSSSINFEIWRSISRGQTNRGRTALAGRSNRRLWAASDTICT